MPRHTPREELQAALDRHQEDTRTAELIIGEEQSLERIARERQAERERRIAECHEVIGRIQAADMFGKLATVSGLVWLRDVKAAGLYREIPGIGNWETFCNRLGKSRRLIDEDIQNLNTFGEQFLETVASLRVGYRDLRKLRQLTHEGTVAVTAEAVTIGGETIPLNPEHREDLQLALEHVIETNAKILAGKEADLKAKERVLADKEELIQKQAADLTALETRLEDKAAELGEPEQAFLRELERRKITVDAQLLHLDPERRTCLLPPDDHTPRMRAAYLTTLAYLARVIDRAYDQAMDRYGAPETSLTDGWVPPAHEV